MTERERGLTRRDLMVRAGFVTAGAMGLGSLAAACGGDDDATAEGGGGGGGGEAEQFTGTLKVTGLGVDLIDPIKAAGEAALGFTLAFDVTDSVTMVQRAITQPQSIDVFSGYHYQLDQIWSSGNLLPIPRADIPRWDEITGLYRTGRVDPERTECTLGDGDAPFRKMYTNEDGSEPPFGWADPETGETSGDEPEYITMVGHNFNMDSMGYNSEVIQKEPGEVSWAELINPDHRGRVAILNDPGIGLQDVANATQAAGILEFGDMGNMTREEIDALVQVLIDLKRNGHFRAFWTTFDESVNFMASGEVVIESMWSPAVTLLQTQGHPTRFAAPPEGFRGWSGGHSVMSHVAEDPSKWQAALAYINWWLDGEPGAIMMRQGYYNVVQETSREFVEPFEWDYWIEGKPAAEPIPNPFGQETAGIPVGSVRDGGSFVDRACLYSSWNSYFDDENEYQLQRWNEFLAA